MLATGLNSTASAAREPAAEPLEFGFISTPTGDLVSLGTHTLHAECLGAGKVTVLFEPGLGGHALEWRPVQDGLGNRTRTCTYDRAGYGWSTASPFPRDARQLAREADGLLAELGIDGPLILVGHSFGGFIVRQLARMRDAQMIGMVLVDSSHEDQFDRLDSLGGRRSLPRGNNFVISANRAPDNLPRDIRRRVAAFARMRKTYSATHGELAGFRLSAEQLQDRQAKVDYPIHVLRRGLDVYAGRKGGADRTAVWTALQNDLKNLSKAATVTIATDSGHHIHADEPDLVVTAIRDILAAYRSRQ